MILKKLILGQVFFILPEIKSIPGIRMTTQNVNKMKTFYSLNGDFSYLIRFSAESCGMNNEIKENCNAGV